MHPKCTVSDKHHFAAGPYIMGVVNVTPDSFSDGGDFFNPDKAIEYGLKLIAEGAHILDIGGESTRPGAQIIEIEEEIRRVVPVIKGLHKAATEQGVQLSIDSRNAKTMRAALKAGAHIINDVSALTHDADAACVVAEAKVPVILMHMRGSPQSMQKKPLYNNVLNDIYEFFEERISFCETHRIDADLLVLDPGIGFGKTLEHNLLILRNIKKFNDLSLPLLLGTSRKSFIAALSQDEPPDDRIAGSLASALWGLSQGVKIIRVHDVRETQQAFKIYQAIESALGES